MQVLSIVNAMSAKAKEFMFMGQMIKCNPNCGIFITMNPGQQSYDDDDDDYVDLSNGRDVDGDDVDVHSPPLADYKPLFGRSSMLFMMKRGLGFA
jgi:hypothetical protein